MTTEKQRTETDQGARPAGEDTTRQEGREAAATARGAEGEPATPPPAGPAPTTERLPGEAEALPEAALAEARERAAAAEAKAAAAEERAATAHDRWLRAQAELDNVRKRTARELSEGLKYANEQLVRELLPVVDNLERALAAVTEESGPVGALRDGVALTLNQFLGVLRKFGVVPVEALGRPFDPNLHEAMAQVESDQPAGTVVTEYQRGYLLNGRLVRPARVAVARSRSEGGAAGGEQEVEGGPGGPESGEGR